MIKKAIDDLRDTIVGKIPMPNTQVEQITLALLYKFMDDMDYASVSLGGNATFFSDEFEKYGWKNNGVSYGLGGGEIKIYEKDISLL